MGQSSLFEIFDRLLQYEKTTTQRRHASKIASEIVDFLTLCKLYGRDWDRSDVWANFSRSVKDQIGDVLSAGLAQRTRSKIRQGCSNGF